MVLAVVVVCVVLVMLVLVELEVRVLLLTVLEVNDAVAATDKSDKLPHAWRHRTTVLVCVTSMHNIL